MIIESPGFHFRAEQRVKNGPWYEIFNHEKYRVGSYNLEIDAIYFAETVSGMTLPFMDDLYRLLTKIKRRVPVPTEPLFISLRIEIAEGDTDNSKVCFTRYLAKVINPLGVYYTFNLTTGYGSTKSLVYTIILSATGVRYKAYELSNQWMTMAVEHMIQPIGVTERLLDYETMWLR
jgi:hypothetical protein